eukprot:gene17089-17279_t
MSNPAARAVTNIIAVVVVVVATATLADRISLWMGSKPFVLCAVYPVLDIGLAHTGAIVLVMIGVIGGALSGFKSAGPVVLIVGGLLLGEPSLHRAMFSAAKRAGVSLNKWVTTALERAVSR